MAEEGAEIELSKTEYTLEGLSLMLKQRDASKKLTHLKLHINQNPSILKEISTIHPSFTHLLFLNLSFNNITSLQPLQKFHLPHLVELHLFHNHISSLRSLRKCSMPSLRMMSVVNNCISELGKICEWNCPSLTQFFAYDNNIELSINAIIKMNCHGLTHIMTNEEAVERHQFAQYCYFVRFDNYKVS